MNSLVRQSVAIMALATIQFSAFQGAAAAATGQCMSQQEAVAEKVRRLKTTLMVGALQCDHAAHLNIAQSYNAFVEAHGATIQAHDQTLSHYFRRAHGAAHRKMMDRHVTSTANKVATQSYKTQGFCEKVSALANLSLTSSPAKLLAVAEKNTIATAQIASCAAPVIQAAQALPR